uniref:Endonuclease 8-like 3 n=1 Tax=Anolis carolinensis TaxID=28377 RepID=A0A803TVN4_ANOCA
MVEGPGCRLNGEKIRARVARGQAVKSMRGSALLQIGASSSSSNGRWESYYWDTTPSIPQLAWFLLFLQINPIYTTYLNSIYPEFNVCYGCAGVIFAFNVFINVRRLKLPLSLPFLSVQLLKMISYPVIFLLKGCYNMAVKPSLKNVSWLLLNLCSKLQACQLTDEQVHHLVKMTRDFTLLFYKCRKTGSALYKHYKVYKRPNCGQCGAKITVCRLGENNRMTYFCPQCQKDNPQRVDPSKLPGRNSLIGWAYGRGSCSKEQVAQKSEEEWSCMLCTLIIKPSVKICDACLTPRPEDLSGFNSDLVKYPCNNFEKPRTEIKINRKTAFGITTLVLTDFASISTQPRPNGSENLTSDGSCLRGSSQNDYNTTFHFGVNKPGTFPYQDKSLTPAQKKQRTDYSPSSERESYFPDNMTDGSCPLSAASPRCNKHSRFCVLRVVRKDGENKGRQFYACPLPKEARCDYFEWADLHFPFCNHGKRCIMRTVLKIGPNNGKNFFVCPLGKDKQCDFFQWAENGPAMKIIPGC